MAKHTHHSHMLKPVFMAAWIITALIAVNYGLTAFGYDFFTLPMVEQNLSNLINPIKYIILAAGILSLVALFMPKDTCGC